MSQEIKKNNVKIWAHRGAVAYAPENTLEAFEWAVKLGADGVELDVHETKDHQIVVIHDDRLERTSSGKGWVKDYTLEELRQFDYSRGTEFWKEKKHAIPTMQEVFELLKPTGLTINIELKTNVLLFPDLEKRLLNMTKEFGMSDRVWYSSFSHVSLQKIHVLDPDARTGLLYADAFAGMPAYAKNTGMYALHPAFFNLFSPRFMEDCRKNGLAVNMWTIDSEEQMLACMGAGVNAIITNYPDKARKVAKSLEDGSVSLDNLTVGMLLRKDKEQGQENNRQPLISIDDQTRQKLYELFRNKYRELEEIRERKPLKPLDFLNRPGKTEES